MLNYFEIANEEVRNITIYRPPDGSWKYNTNTNNM